MIRQSLQRPVLTIALFLCVAAPLEAQQRPYTEGPVVEVTNIRTKPGQYDNYLNYIFGDYARLMEAQKAEGMILSWGVYTLAPRTPDEPDLVLTVVYPNMAALDGFDDRSEPIVARVMNRNRSQAATASEQRESVRTILGSTLLRNLAPRP
jgi:hypothetical protein